MSPRASTRSAIACLSLLASGIAATPARAQGMKPNASAPPPAPAAQVDRALPESDAALEAYLSRPGLKLLLAEHLAQRLKSAPVDEHPAIADRLGHLYIELIAAAKSVPERTEWETLARELVRSVPQAAALDLRMELARAIYLKGEAAAERFRLRLSTDAEAADARATLAETKAQFEALAVEIGRRADNLARAEDSGRATDAQIAESTDARRLRSTALYYAGWASCYLSLVNNAPGLATEALQHLGYVLCGTLGRPPNYDKFQKELLRYDSTARAAVGAALAHSQTNNAAEALRWLDLVEAEPAIVPELRQQLLARRITILARAGRWADIQRAVGQARRPVAQGGARSPAPTVSTPLEPATARLLAIVAFEAHRSAADDLVSSLAQTAMQDLIARGDVAQVLDLAGRFGTAGLGETGFIAHFVRGVQAYEQATAADKASPAATSEPVEPTADAALANRFRQAAAALDASTTQSDAASFTSERARAKITAGRALFRAGDLAAAAKRFAEASEISNDNPQIEESLWLAIIASERLVRQAPSDTAAASRLEELSTLYLRRFPQSERAAALLLRRMGKASMSDEEALKVLMAIGRDTPIFDAARRQSARLLYKAFRTSDEADRAFAAGRFAAVAEEVLEADRREATRADAVPGSPAQALAVERGIAVARQLLDALLWGQTPDPARAEAVLESLRAMALHANVDLTKHEGELLYRRVQIASARADAAGAESLAAQLRGIDPSLADSAERLFYQRALSTYRRLPPLEDVNPPADRVAARVDAARALVVAGERIIGRTPPTAEALREPVLQTIYRQVAEANAAIFRLAGDSAARERAVQLDRLVLEVAPGNRDSLQRIAMFAEDTGDSTGAAEAWASLAASSAEGSPAWFEARFNVIRLTAQKDPPAAATLFAQLALLHPDLGPEPWRSKLSQLRATLPTSPPPGGSPPPAPAPARGALPQ